MAFVFKEFETFKMTFLTTILKRQKYLIIYSLLPHKCYSLRKKGFWLERSETAETRWGWGQRGSFGSMKNKEDLHKGGHIEKKDKV